MRTGFILVVEGDPALRQTLHAVLQLAGFEFQVAGSGLEAKRIMRGGTPSLILIERSLPDMDGLTIIKDAPCATQSILMTGSKKDLEDLPKKVQVLLKPFDLDELLGLLDQLLS
jgi:DNA-binding response OmpR family regulator